MVDAGFVIRKCESSGCLLGIKRNEKSCRMASEKRLDILQAQSRKSLVSTQGQGVDVADFGIRDSRFRAGRERPFPSNQKIRQRFLSSFLCFLMCDNDMRVSNYFSCCE